jgi:4-hydroxybenzoate polyprenyltransferase
MLSVSKIQATPNLSLKDKLIAYAQMIRPANIVTAWADILVGYAAAGAIVLGDTSLVPLFWLLLATTGLYGGGVVFNDVFDAELDSLERPERPIPSGRASRYEAILLGTGLLALGIFAASRVSEMSGWIAFSIAIIALLYDAASKHNPVLGPLNMGMCRGGNWLLGVSAIPGMLWHHSMIALVPIIYIAAITVLSRGEVHGGNGQSSRLALGLIAVVAVGLALLGYLPDYAWRGMLPFGLLWLVNVVPSFWRTLGSHSPDLVRKAVRTGVISLIVLDSAIAAGFSHWVYGLGVLALLPLSRFLAGRFAVT